jgi:hypothetical protein
LRPMEKRQRAWENQKTWHNQNLAIHVRLHLIRGVMLDKKNLQIK